MIPEIVNAQNHESICYLSDEVKYILCINHVEIQTIYDDHNLWTDQAKCNLNLEYLSKNCMVFDEQKTINYSQSNKNLKKYLGNIKKTMINNFDINLIEAILGNDLEIFKKSIFNNLSFIKNSNPSPSMLDIELAFTVFFPLFERFLGNVLFSLNGGINSKIPFLLRDLVNCSLFDSVFTNEIINFIKLFFYTPKSLNLRNLCWHGFLNTHEYDSSYIYFLICLLCNINHCLKEKKILLKSRQKFNLKTLEPLWLEHNVSLLKSFSLETKLEFFSQIENSKLVDECRREKWKLIFSEKLDNFSLLNLILPELEHVLRKLYSLANNLPESCSAQIAYTNEFYLTLDDLLSWKIASSDRRNFLLDFIDEKVCVLMFDLFHYIDGPRLRDHLSHGELEPNVDDFYVNALLYTMTELADGNQKINFKIKKECYECNFHPIKVLKWEISRLFNSFFYSKNSRIIDIGYLEKLKFDDELNLLYRYEKFELKILKSNELQLINLCRNLTKEIGKYQSKLTDKQILNESLRNNIHSLRERQRASLEKFDIFKENFIVFFNLNLKVICFLVQEYFFNDCKENFFSSPKFFGLVKLLKFNLKLYQNLFGFCEYNKWIESCELISLNDNNNVLAKIEHFLLSP
ncbi:endoplasmic reticulum membrane-associated RNA degradation isoform X1 [Brachionus plicatilis]|uniref:Endoplasmic reticulum membrane-associated RNA degradation isoform X1 n=1 Tax=Brachionus plicatilis TaxID=10195 RepID=A0A3M7QLG9_BRAPC|nr:endoplasmic reticulum membrane-associated RNA degradation isoform X1 [Brachionus plicatilis]